MNKERIAELALKCAHDIFQPNAGRPEDVIAQMLRTALLEEAREEPDEEMQIAGYQAHALNSHRHNVESHIYRAMQAVLARRLEK